MEQESTTLILNTFDISTSTTASDFYNTTLDNQYGTIANNRCTLTWKNINMRRVLGEMYDKFETFNMYLYQINQSSAFWSVAPVSNVGFLLVNVNIKGLQFLNNTYSVKTSNNTGTAFLTSYLLNNSSSTGVGTVTPMFNPSILTFGKSTECVDITIDMKTAYSQTYTPIVAPVGGLAENSNSFGTFIFMFKFYGIPKRDNIITNGTRM